MVINQELFKHLWHMRTTKVQARLHIRAVSPEPMLFSHISGRPKKTSAEELISWPC